MKKPVFMLIFPIFLFLSEIIHFVKLEAATEQKIFTGTIQWPTALSKTPSVRINHGGIKIDTQLHKESNKVTFTIFDNKTIFYIIVTPEINWVVENNVIKYRTLCPSYPHKVFVLELIAHESHRNKKFSLTSLDKVQPSYWNIKEIIAPTNDARIPDESIIVRLDPSWVQGMEGGSMVELPKMIIRPDVVTLVGSEEKIHDQAAKWILAAINTDTFHGGIDKEIRVGQQPKTIMAFNLN